MEDSGRVPARLADLDLARSPKHVAIILDGNGRWAKARGLSRSEGHKAGGETLTRMLDVFIKLNIPVVSLYAFSTENWKRPKTEVNGLWKLMNQFFESRLEKCMELGVRVMASGDISQIPAKNRERIQRVIDLTRKHKRLTANFCVNYGAQAEILRAASAIVAERLALAEQGESRKAHKPVGKAEFEKRLYTAGLPDVDLLVRPGGESRVSNFLLWQIAYAEIYVTDALWPDFTEQNLVDALWWFQNRNRRFGGL